MIFPQENMNFHINSAGQTKLVEFFPGLKSTNHFLPQSTVAHRADLSSEVTSSCHHKIYAWLHLEQRVVSSAYTAILQITPLGSSLT